MTYPKSLLRQAIENDIANKKYNPMNDMEELAMNEAAIQTALDAAAVFMQNKKERLNYLNREMAILDYESDKDAWIAEGRIESLLDSVRSLMHKKGWSSDEAMDVLSITPEERAIISARL